MDIEKKLLEEKNIRAIFRLSLVIKGVLAVGETIVGILAYFVTQNFLLSVITLLAHDELSEDPKDFISNYLIKTAKNLSPHSQHFAAFYLVSHGIIKLWLVSGLMRRKLWYYPTSLGVFGLFIIYQIIRFASTHSIWLLIITVLDLFVIALTWHEYRYLRKEFSKMHHNKTQ